MDLRKLKTLIDLVSQSGISELEVTEGESKVHIVKHAPPVYIQQSPALPMISSDTMGQAKSQPVSGGTGEISGASATPTDYLVKSLMVGTFFRASSPGADPFVEIGDRVKKEQTLCIIEAMKLLNEVGADRAGIIKEICIENGQPVGYGQPLFVIGECS